MIKPTSHTKKLAGIEPEDLELLLQPRKGPCVSITLQLFEESKMMKHNAGLLRNAIINAKNSLEGYECSSAEKSGIARELDKIQERFERQIPAGGFGIFVAPDITRVISFPFIVNECVIVDRSFETRDLLYLRQYLAPYYVLQLSRNSIRLFTAHADAIEEVRDSRFPMQYKDDFEYARSVKGTSFGFAAKGFEHDKGSVLKMRLHAFMRQASRNFQTYLQGPVQTLVLAGAPQLIKFFQDELSLHGHVIGLVPGNFGKKNHRALAREAWKTCKAVRDEEIKKLIARLDDQALRFKVKGLRKVWEAARDGRGLLLLVEKDYRHPAYIPPGTDQIRLHPPGDKYTFIADAVDDVIEKVLSKHGQVFITEPNQLGKFENIGMMLRY